MHSRHRLRLRVIPPRIVESNPINIALLDIFCKFIVPDPVPVRIPAEEQPDGAVIVEEDVRVDGGNVSTVGSGFSDGGRGWRDEIGRGHEEVDVVVGGVEGVVVDWVSGDVSEGAGGRPGHCDTDSTLR